MNSAGEFTLPKNQPREKAIQRVAAYLAILAPDKDWLVTIGLKKRRRSDAQNRYLHGVAYKILSDKTGYEIPEIADFMLGTYFGWTTKKVPKKPSNPAGIESVPIRRTTKNADGERDVLTTLQFQEYVEWIQRFAAQKGWDIPDPDPEYFRHEQRKAA